MPLCQRPTMNRSLLCHMRAYFRRLSAHLSAFYAWWAGGGGKWCDGLMCDRAEIKLLVFQPKSIYILVCVCVCVELNNVSMRTAHIWRWTEKKNRESNVRITMLELRKPLNHMYGCAFVCVCVSLLSELPIYDVTGFPSPDDGHHLNRIC